MVHTYVRMYMYICRYCFRFHENCKNRTHKRALTYSNLELTHILHVYAHLTFNSPKMYMCTNDEYKVKYLHVYKYVFY